MRSFTFRHLERLVVLLAVVVYLYAAFTLLAHPHGVSGVEADSAESLSADEAKINWGMPVRLPADTGSLTKANPETPHFCDQTRHNMYLDVSNPREETHAIKPSAWAPDNPTTDPRDVRHDKGRKRVFIPKR